MGIVTMYDYDNICVQYLTGWAAPVDSSLCPGYVWKKGVKRGRIVDIAPVGQIQFRNFIFWAETYIKY